MFLKYLSKSNLKHSYHNMCILYSVPVSMCSPIRTYFTEDSRVPVHARTVVGVYVISTVRFVLAWVAGTFVYVC